MSHIICQTCHGLNSVLDETGVKSPCPQCMGIGVVAQATGRPEGYVAPEPVEEAPEDAPAPPVE